MPVQMVDGNQRKPARERDRLGGGQPDQQRADQTRPFGHRHRRDVVERGPGVVERRLDHRRTSAPGGGATRPRAPPRRSAHAAAACEDTTFERIATVRRSPPRRSRRTRSRCPRISRGSLLDVVAPHDHGVLAVVRVVAAADRRCRRTRAARRGASRPSWRPAPRACSRGRRRLRSLSKRCSSSARAIPRPRYGSSTAMFIMCQASTYLATIT